MEQNKSISLITLQPAQTAVISEEKLFAEKVLKIPASLRNCWDIVDTFTEVGDPESGLLLVHYNEEYDPELRSHEPLRRVRGIIIDKQTGAIISESLGHDEVLSCHGPLTETKTSITFETEIRKYVNSFEAAPDERPKITVGTREFPKDKTAMFLGYEGAIIRIFKWNNKIFFSSHRKIDAKKSGWGGRTIFLDIYKRLGGPPIESFYGDEITSPYCHMFLIADNEIRLASSTSDNRIIYLGVKKVWNEEEYAQEDGPYYYPGEFPLITPQFTSQISPFASGDVRPMLMQPAINVGMVNKFMFPNQFAPDVPPTPEAIQYGAKEHEMVVDYSADGSRVNEIYFRRMAQKMADERLNGGDFIVIFTQGANGETIVYRLETLAFQYRVQITADDPNLYHRFAIEMVSFTKGNPHELLTNYPKYIGSDDKELDLSTPQSRQIYWWSLYHDAVAPVFKKEVQTFYSRYDDDVEELSKFILNDFPKLMTSEKVVKDTMKKLSEGKIKDTDIPEDLKRKIEEFKRINEKTQTRIKDLQLIATNSSSKVKTAPFIILKNLLYKETGQSLYKMITTMQNLKKLRVQTKAAQPMTSTQ